MQGSDGWLSNLLVLVYYHNTAISSALIDVTYGILINCILLYSQTSIGFRSQGNEFSYYMLIASNFILNRTAGGQFPIHPFIHNFCNNIAKDDQVRKIFKGKKRVRQHSTVYFAEIMACSHSVVNFVICAVVKARAVMIPDVVPGDELGGAADFSMVAGDFLECYTEEGMCRGREESDWDCVLCTS